REPIPSAGDQGIAREHRRWVGRSRRILVTIRAQQNRAGREDVDAEDQRAHAGKLVARGTRGKPGAPNERFSCASRRPRGVYSSAHRSPPSEAVLPTGFRRVPGAVMTAAGLLFLSSAPAHAVLDINDHGPVLEQGGFRLRVTNAGI